MSNTLQGGCFCGQSRYNIEGEISFAIQCYCRDCQHQTGGGHAPQFAVKRTSVEKSGPIKTYASTSDRGKAIESGFCGECGSPIYKMMELAPELIFFFAGSLDDPSVLPEPRKVFEDRRQPWDRS
jgi:hypothetical protein